jgi:hypothetical protein
MRSAGLVPALLLVASTALAREPSAIRLRFPRVPVPGGTNPEVCVPIMVPTTTPFDVASIEIRHVGVKRPAAVQHFLIYAYTGENLAALAFPYGAGTPIPSRGCLDFGPADRDRRQLIASGTVRTSRSAPLPGGALRLAPVPSQTGGSPAGLGFVLDGEWLNPGTRTRTVSAVVILRRARASESGHIALPFTDASAEAGLLVPPNQIGSTEDLPAGKAAAWGPGRAGVPNTDLCVLSLTGQMHKRGRFFGVDLIGPGGAAMNPAGGIANPFVPGRQHLFGAFDWTDEGSLLKPFRLAAGQALHYACWADNGSARAARLGCEETTNVVPGSVGHPAMSCLSGADCPAPFTGVCEPANLVAGPGTDDEICRLDGTYITADQAPGCGAP